MSSSTDGMLVAAAAFEDAWRSAAPLERRAVRVRAALRRTPLFRVPSAENVVQIQVPFASWNRAGLRHEYRRLLATESLRVTMEGLIRAATGRRERRWRNEGVSVFQDSVHIHAGAPADDVAAAMDAVFEVVGAPRDMADAAAAHLAVLRIHPLPDGNGHLARTIALLMIGRLTSADCRAVNLAAQLDRDRPGYYAAIACEDQASLEPILTGAFIRAAHAGVRQLTELRSAAQEVTKAAAPLEPRTRRDLVVFGWALGRADTLGSRAGREHSVHLVYRDARTGIGLYHAPAIAAALEVPYFFTMKQSD